MADDIGRQIGRFFQGLRQKTTETVQRQEEAFVRGKIAGTAVLDESGDLIVDAGHRIDDTIIARAQAAGKLHALAMAVGTGQVQDLKERASDHFGATPDALENRSLNSVDDYIEARRYIGRTAGVDVTDIRGNIIVPAGKEIKDDDVRLAREAGQLSALVYSAQQPAPPKSETESARPAANETYRPVIPQTVQRRASVPLVMPDPDEEGK